MIFKYDPKEERLNTLSHGLGLLLSIIALPLLVVFASLKGTVWHVVSFSIYGVSLVLLYLASTLYHGVNKPELKTKLKVFDHASIYVLIAGTYTPFLFISLNGAWGWSLFGVVWGIALVGIIFKFFFTGRFDRISTVAYVLMGWVVVVAVKPLIANLELGGLFWLVTGGISYSVGAIFYMWNKLPYNHAIFHVFVLAGSVFHFIAVFNYLLP